MRCFLHPFVTAATRIFRSSSLRFLPPKAAVTCLLPSSRSLSRSKPTPSPRIIPAHSSGLIQMSESAPSTQGALPVIALTPTEAALFNQLKEFAAHKNSSGQQPLFGAHYFSVIFRASH